MFDLVGVVIEDGLFATIIGASFVASLGLMAWIVKKLAELDTKVDLHDWRLQRLEDRLNGEAAARKPSRQ